MTITKFENHSIFDVAKDVHARVLLEKLGYTYIDGTWQLGVPKTLMQASPAYIPVHIKIEEPIEEAELGVGSFDGLVQVKEFQEGDFFFAKKLSPDQKGFLQENINTYSPSTFIAQYLSVDIFIYRGGVFMSAQLPVEGMVGCPLFFNDIFKHKSEV